jgi:hypothetical protein
MAIGAIDNCEGQAFNEKIMKAPFRTAGARELSKPKKAQAEALAFTACLSRSA